MNVKNGAILNCRGVSKAFPGVKALDKVDFDIRPGEIHGLVGENGAGKSTLMKIFSGIYSYDERELPEEEYGMFFNGERVVFRSPSDALKHKIMTIHQEINVVPDLTVYENVYLNAEVFKHGFLDRKKMIQETAKLIETFGVEFSPTDIVGNLSADRQKLVEVLKAISKEVKVLIMDEPTSVLADAEAAHLFETVRTIARKGIGVVFISHNLNEVIKICDRVTVLRDGRKVAELNNAETLDVDTIVSYMVGNKLASLEVRTQGCVTNNKAILRVKKLNYKNLLKDISFELYPGEILGITGLVGSGGTQLAKVLFGAEGYRKSSGEVFRNGIPIDIHNPQEAIRNGISLLTDDRKSEGLFLQFKLYENSTIASLKKYIDKLGLLKRKDLRRSGENYIEKLKIKTSGADAIVESLSGGNQQKVVIAKWLETKPDIFIMDEPTVGIDIGAKAEVRKIIQELVSRNKSVILITNEYAEIDTLCNRVLIMFKGSIMGEFNHDEINEAKLMKYSLGGGI